MKRKKKLPKYTVGGVLQFLQQNPQLVQTLSSGLGGSKDALKANASTSIKSGVTAAANSAVPGLGTAIQVSGQLGQSIKGDGTSIGKNIVGNVFNPLNKIDKIMDGKFDETIPVVGGVIEARRAKAEKEKQARLDAGMKEMELKSQSSANLAGYPTQGVKGAQMFRLGGALKSFQQGGPMQAIQGGQGVPLSEDGQMMVGNSHGQGGIPIADETGQPVAEVEGGEVINKTSDGQDFVSSAVLTNPKTGNSFSDDMAKLEIEKGKYQKLQEKRPKDPRVKGMLDKVQAEIDVLATEQEAMKEQQMAEQQQQQQQQQQQVAPQQMQEQQMPLQEGMPQDPAMQQQMQGEMEMKLGGKLPKFYPGGWLQQTSLRVPNQTYKQEEELPRATGKLLNNSIINSNGDATTNGMGQYSGLFLDNIGNAIANRQREKLAIPRQDRLSYITPDLVNLDNQRAAINSSEAATRNALSAGGASRANLIANRAASLQSLGQINRTEANDNANILTKNRALNADVRQANSSIKLGNDVRYFQGQQNFIGQRAENTADLSKDIQVIQKDKKLEEVTFNSNMRNLALNDPDMLGKLAVDGGMSAKEKAWFMKSQPQLWKKIEEAARDYASKTNRTWNG